MGLVGGAVVGCLGGPAFLAPFDARDEAAVGAMLLCALLGGVLNVISEWQHRRWVRRLDRLTPELEEIPDG